MATPEVLSPFVYWGQNNNYIFLKVDLKDCSKPEVQLDEDAVVFSANGVGMRGRNNYTFSLEFYLPIDSEKSQYRVTERNIEFQIQKVGVGEVWPRLTISQKKPGWLKIDFDKFALEDDSDNAPDEEEEMNKAAEEELMRKLEKEITKAEDWTFKDVKSFWLFVYNMFQWVGYSYVFMVLLYKYYQDGEDSKLETMESVGSQLMVCQVVAIMEIIHPLLGIVKTGVLMPLIQVFGRNMVLFMVITPEPRLHSNSYVWWLFLIWTAVELVRYPFYMLSSIGKDSKTITWLRYTMWIPLYPAGFALEGIVIMTAVPMFEMTGKWSLEMPNFTNMAFSFPIFLQIYLVIFLFGMYQLLRRMHIQRKKKLGSIDSKKKMS